MNSIQPLDTASGPYFVGLMEDYYLNGREPLGQWDGRGALHLGLTGEVERQSLLNIFQGFTPDGKGQLVQNAGAKHMPGTDLTFSAPKSVSLLWALADDDTRRKIETAHSNAVKLALGYLEDTAGVCRTGKGGSVKKKRR